ncbi:hypothetical protein [Streptomyces mirabilis]|uniref:hypothetical protein n=1 Tax=Streptomyces mirabilis TaxID=68239 RepID=UPI0036D0B099
MTRHFEHDPHTQAVNHWLDQNQRTLDGVLDASLDIEAGLREILLHSRHNTAVDGLNTILDTEAGLAAILPTAPQRRPDTPSDSHDAVDGHLDTEEFLRSMSPAGRIALRNHIIVKAASRPLAGDIDLARKLTRAPARGGSSSGPASQARIRALAHADVLACDLARTLHRTLTPSKRYLSRRLAHTLALNLDPRLTRNLDRVPDRQLAHELASDIADTLAAAPDRQPSPELELALDIAHTLKLAHSLDRSPSPDRRDARHLADVVVAARTKEVCRAIGRALQRKPPTLGRDSARAFLDDFTTADLSSADLTSIDLRGVRWSQNTTRWPATVDVEALKARSKEAPSGSGIWIVHSGNATIHDFADLG